MKEASKDISYMLINFGVDFGPGLPFHKISSFFKTVFILYLLHKFTNTQHFLTNNLLKQLKIGVTNLIEIKMSARLNFIKLNIAVNMGLSVVQRYAKSGICSEVGQILFKKTPVSMKLSADVLFSF